MKTKKLTQKEKIKRALATLSKFYYTNEGTITRYPEEPEFKEARALLESIVEENK